MPLEYSAIIYHCETEMNTVLPRSVRLLVEKLFNRYVKVLNGEQSVDDVRRWYVRSADVYTQFRKNGDPVDLYQRALDAAQIYCEEALDRQDISDE